MHLPSRSTLRCAQNSRSARRRRLDRCGRASIPRLAVRPRPGCRSAWARAPLVATLHCDCGFMGVSYPRLFLGAGVTTIRTTGSVELVPKTQPQAADRLAAHSRDRTSSSPGHICRVGASGPGAMHPLSGPDDARRMVRYSAEEGVTWFKAYTQISRADLAAAIDEAHEHGVKLTAHLCSVGFREAVASGYRPAGARAAHQHRVLQWQAGRRLSAGERHCDVRRPRHQQRRRPAQRSGRWWRATSR